MYVACIKDNDCKCGSYCFGSYRIKWAFVCADGGFEQIGNGLAKTGADPLQSAAYGSWKEQDGECDVRDWTGAGGNPLDEAALRAALQNKTCQNTAGAVRCEKLSKPFSLWQCADYEPVELPCSADVRTAGRCHCGRKYCGGKAKCLCTGQCKCPERSVRRMDS